MTPLLLNTGIEEVREHSTWFLVMGIALVVLGLIAIGYTVEMTIISVLFLAGSSLSPAYSRWFTASPGCHGAGFSSTCLVVCFTPWQAW